jgi:hypothetical protein
MSNAGYDPENAGVAPRYDKEYDHGREDPQYISGDPSRDPHYDANKDPRNYPPAPELSPPMQAPPVHKAAFPDASESDITGAETSSSRRQDDDSFSFLGTQRQGRRVFFWLIICTGSAFVLLAALVGAIVGAVFLGGGSDDSDPALTPPVPTQPNPKATDTPVASPPTGEGANPTPALVESTAAPVAQAAAPTASPTGAPTVSPTGAPTEDFNKFPKDQALYDVILGLSSDAGASIIETGSPQNRAFNWLQEDIYKDSLSIERKTQRYAMACFFYSTQGETWINNGGWLEGIDECLWHTDAGGGFSCVGELLTILELRKNNVEGVLPPELGMLTGLTRIAVTNLVGGTGLGGGIPKELGQVGTMIDVEFEGNSFTEPIPPELFDKWALADKFLVQGNKIPGPIPTTIGKLVTAERITLSDNAFTGEIPTEVGLMTIAKNFFLQNNQLTGPIPAELGNMQDLKAGIDLSNNKLTGPIPASLATISGMKVFLVHNNELTGQVPDFAALNSLKEFRIDGNSLTGSVSPGTCTAILIKGADAYADCTEVVCSCCTHCCVDGECAKVTQ